MTRAIRSLALPCGIAVLSGLAVAGAVTSAPHVRIDRGVTSFGWKIETLPAAAGRHRASFGEPGLTADAKGDLVANAARANVGYPTLWISRNDGASWGPGRDFDQSGAKTGDADAQVGSDGFLYALNLGFTDPPSQPSNPTVLVYRSRHWRRWHGPATFPPPHGQDQPDRPWLVTVPNKPTRVYVFNSEGTGDIVAWRSDDHARSFSGPTPVTAADQAAGFELSSRPLIDPTDPKRIFMMYEAGSSNGPTDTPPRDFPVTQLWLARSDDEGATWSNSLVLDIGTAFGSSAGGSLGHILPASAIDRAGGLYAAFSLRLGNGTSTHLYLVHSTDAGAHWSGPVRIDSAELASNVLPALTAGAPGRIDLTWYGSRSSDFTNGHAKWAEMFAQSLDALSRHPTFAQSRISGSLPVHVGSVNSAGNPGSSLYDWDLRDFQSVVVDRCGMAHVAWTNDNHRGSTAVATQTKGHSLLSSRHRC